MILALLLAAQILPPTATTAGPPLNCEKYQHVYHWSGNCGPSPCDSVGGCSAVCYPPPPDRCVDDMHEVTEKEWQKLIERLKYLEEHVLDWEPHLSGSTR